MGSTIGLSACALLLLAMALLPQFYLRAANIHGNRRVSAATLYALSGVDGRHVFHVDPTRVAARLERLPAIESARVEASLPAHLLIRVEETPLALRWESPAGGVAIDARGRLAPLEVADASIPLIRSESPLPAPPIAGLEPGLVAAGLTFAEQFGSPLGFRASAGFIHHSPEGWEVWLGEDAQSAPTQALRLDALREELAGREQQRPVERIDLRFEQWYYRLQGESP